MDLWNGTPDLLSRIIAGKKAVSQLGKTSSGAAFEPPARAPLHSHGCDALPSRQPVHSGSFGGIPAQGWAEGKNLLVAGKKAIVMHA